MMYLDTSVIRSLGGGLSTTHRRDLVTSALTVVELVTAAFADGNSFERVRSGLRAISTGSTVSIDWRLPDDPLALSFDWIKDNCSTEEHRLESLKGIADLVVASPALSDLVENERAARYRFPIEYWCEFDGSFGRAYTDATRGGNIELKQAFDRVRRGESKAAYLGSAARDMTYREFCVWFAREQSGLNRSATIQGLARRVAADMMNGDPTDELVAAIHDSYNDSIGIFVDAFSWRAMINHGDGRSPARNDALDLAHFLYLEPDSVLATDDNGMRETALAIKLSVVPSAEVKAP